jgi:hypothetical protein
MDLLYSRYSNPMDLMERYIKQRRFGEFVQGFLKAEYERKKQEAEKEQEWMLWVAYVHSYSDKSFSEWKKTVIKPESTTRRRGSDASMTEKDVQSIMDGLFKQE